MLPMSRSRSVIALLAVTLFALAACKRPAPVIAPVATLAPSATVAPPMAEIPPAPATPSLGDFKIIRISLGRSLDIGNDIAEESAVFAPKDQIYAAVISTGSHQGLKLSARWLDAGGHLLAQNDQRMVPDGPMLATFHLRQSNGWPKGHYTLAIAADEQSLLTKDFEVR